MPCGVLTPGGYPNGHAPLPVAVRPRWSYGGPGQAERDHAGKTAEGANDGKPDLWVVDTDGDGKADLFQFDHTGDGEVDLTIIDRTQDGNPDEIIKGDAGLPPN
jgi:hypothetical protein